jgi:hypothetical protein
MTLWDRFTAFLQRIVWFFKNQLLLDHLQSGGEAAKSEVEEILARIVAETGIAPDCVSAQILRGGHTILVKHNLAWEAFIHNSYPEAAERAISWIKFQGYNLKTGEVSSYNRAQRRKLKALSKRDRG